MVVGMGEAMNCLPGGAEGLQILTDVLQRVRDGGDLQEEDDGYYSSSDEEGPVTAEMAARGVGEAGCVVVADSIWNRQVPREPVRVYSRVKRDREEETSPSAKRGPLESMLESLRVDTGGLHLTSAPSTARMFPTYKNKQKCCAILDARKVNASDLRKPPKFRLPALEGIRRWMGVLGQAGSAVRVLEYHTTPQGGAGCSLYKGVGGRVPLCTPALRLELQPGHLPTICIGSSAQGPLTLGDTWVGIPGRYPAVGEAQGAPPRGCTGVPTNAPESWVHCGCQE